jgi:hypothetical protein
MRIWAGLFGFCKYHIISLRITKNSLLDRKQLGTQPELDGEEKSLIQGHDQ